MPRLRVNAFSISLDGFGAGADQSLQAPLGVGGERLHGWALPTRSFQQKVFGNPDGGTTGVDEDFAARSFEGIGAWILGRNMFAPSRGPWPADDPWQGWWGDEPPYHCPVFVLTHHARAPLAMEGGTVFHFVTEGPEAALALAQQAAGARDVRVGGGVATVRHYLRTGQVDEMHLAVAPVLLGRGEALLAGLDLPALGYRVSEHVATAACTHVVLRRDA
jgi:dihydrofolate reductase